MMVVFWALGVTGIVALVKVVMTRSGASESRSAETPFGILRRRYAAGEFTNEQFEAMKRDVA